MSCKTTLCRLGMAVALLLGAAGCQDDGQRNVDSYVRDIASRPLDVTPLPAATGPATPQANWPVDSDPSLPAPRRSRVPRPPWPCRPARQATFAGRSCATKRPGREPRRPS